LSQRSTRAARQIKTLISASKRHVGSGVRLVNETGQLLNQIVAQVAEVTNVVSDIAVNAQEQAAGLAAVNAAINQMDRVTQQNAAMADECTTSTHSLAGDIAELDRLTVKFLGEHATRPQPVQPARSANVVQLHLVRPSSVPGPTLLRGPKAEMGKA
jgi:methyl-accepting chemotaxis protein